MLNCINVEAGVYELEITINSLYSYKTPEFTVQYDDIIQFLNRTQDFINSEKEYFYNAMLDPWLDIRLFRNMNTEQKIYSVIIVLDAGLLKTGTVSTSSGPGICLEVTAESLNIFNENLIEEINKLQ